MDAARAAFPRCASPEELCPARQISLSASAEPTTTAATTLEAERATLGRVELIDTGHRKTEEAVELLARKCPVLARALHFDEAALAAHDHVHIHGSRNVLFVVEIQAGSVGRKTYADRRHAPLHR